MHDCPGLRKELKRINGRGYPAYRDIKGVHDFGDFSLSLDRIQGDPFASPSRIRVIIPDSISGFPSYFFDNEDRKTAFEDFIARRFGENLKRRSGGRKGSGKSGLIYLDPLGQEVLRRTSVVKISGSLEVRFFAGLPADGRRINSGAAAVMLLEIIPEAVEGSLYYKNTDAASLENHIRLYEDTVFIRSMLHEMNITAFIGNDSSLPRRSGIDDRPMGTENAVSFTSPKSLEVSIDTPNSGTISGMGIPEGITLIAGGGYHGKSTLLRAIERGIYSHIAGDGREFVVTNPDAVKIRSEDGRRIESVDITPFIMNLPFGRDTVDFRTDNASGSTSQAANIMESIESGAKVFLIDEDTSATNFMIRDRRMRKLVPDENEPITPYIDRIGSLYDELGISSIIVAGGCGDYIDVADTVICMKDYGAHDATERAKSIAAGDSASCIRDRGRYGYPEISRVPDRGSIDPGRGKNRVKISVKEEGKIEFGRERIDMASVEQVSGKSQLRAIGLAINYSLRYMDGRRNVEEIAGLVMDDIGRSGPDVVSGSIRGDLESFRWEELCAALNRLRTLEIL